MARMLIVGTVAALLAAWLQPPARMLGARLAPGMQLVYSSGGVEAPWTIGRVARDTSIGGHPGCLWYQLRTSPSAAEPETRIHCVDGRMMTTWSAERREHRPVRPLGAGVLSTTWSGGGTVSFDADAVVIDTVSGIPLHVVPTTVLTTDSTGRPVRRLRERFAIELATATRGVFEVPDSSVASGWREQRRFELVAIRPGR